MTHLILTIFLQICLLACAPINTYNLSGNVIKVVDGDTLTIITDYDRKLRVRLYGIDAPEIKQSFGVESQENLSSLCLDTQAQLILMSADKYGRLIAIVYCKGINANISQLENGLAWAYTKYLDDEVLKDTYINAEMFAKSKKIGLWSESKQIQPWEYRRNY